MLNNRVSPSEMEVNDTVNPMAIVSNHQQPVDRPRKKSNIGHVLKRLSCLLINSDQ
jgi:hypothetical protein